MRRFGHQLTDFVEVVLKILGIHLRIVELALHHTQVVDVVHAVLLIMMQETFDRLDLGVWIVIVCPDLGIVFQFLEDTRVHHDARVQGFLRFDVIRVDDPLAEESAIAADGIADYDAATDQNLVLEEQEPLGMHQAEGFEERSARAPNYLWAQSESPGRACRRSGRTAWSPSPLP